MALLFSVENLSKDFDDKTLFEDVSFSVFEGDKIALIGKNGSGKSTILKILLDIYEYSYKGNVIKSSILNYGYLQQHDDFFDNETILEYLMRKSDKADWECGKFAGYFDLKGEMLNKKIVELSGGYQTRVKLTLMFLLQPNFIFLDEPTNYLDIKTLVLLEKVLINFNGGYLIVSHDRNFLNNLCNKTLSIINGKLYEYNGNILEFENYRKEQIEHAKKYNKNIEAKQKQLNEFITKFKAKATKATQAKSKQKQLEKLNTIEIDEELYEYRFKLPEISVKKGVYAVKLNNLSIGYKDKVVAKNIDFEISQGEKLHFVGNNGEGKTTLLNTIFGDLPKLDGEIVKNVNLNVGYYSQNVYEAIKGEILAIDYLNMMNYSNLDIKSLRNIAGSFRFSPDQLDRKIETLSGGERARLLLCSLMLGNYNTLILDEPTNHLDIETIDALIYALKAYTGTLIVVSHDQYLATQLNFDLIEIDSGELLRPHYNFNEFLKKIENSEDNNFLIKDKKNTQSAKDEYLAQKKRKSEINRLTRLVKELEQELDKLNSQRENLIEKLNNEFTIQLSKEIEVIENNISQLEEDWLIKTEELDKFTV